jgi:hypothetical protein
MSKTYQFDSLKHHAIYGVVILILLLINFKSCRDEQAALSDLSTMIEYKDKLVSRIAKDSATLVSQAVKIVQSDRLEAALTKEIKDMEMYKPTEVVKYRTKTVVKTEIQLAEPVYIDSFPHLKLPRPFYKKDKHFTMGGEITRLGRLQIDSLIIPTSYTVAIGDTIRKGLINKLFKVSDPVVRIKVDNPNVQITSMSNFVVRKPPKWYQTTGFKIGIGAIIGFGLAVAAP